MQRFLLFIFYLFFVFIPDLCAQNLVSNPSFKTYVGRPVSGHTTLNCCKDWFSAYMMGTDYYNRKINRGEAVPKNDLGTQEPRTGDGYAGFCMTPKYLEYLQTKLKDTLREGKRYLFEFYVSRSEKSVSSVDEFGVLFSGQARREIPESGLTDEPSIKLKSEHNYRDKDEWMKVSGIYEAEGYETHMIFGYFDYNKHMNFIGFCHYYVDDVSLTLISDETNSDPAEVTIEELKEHTAEEKPIQEFAPKTGEIVKLENVFFNSNESELLPASFSELDNLIDYLNAEPNKYILISGHTDNQGDEKQNLALSEARAKAVGTYLVSKGIEKNRINSKGYGSSRPVAENKNAKNRQMNRRVEFVIFDN